MTTTKARESEYEFGLEVRPLNRQRLPIDAHVRRTLTDMVRLEERSAGGAAVEIERESDGTIRVRLFADRAKSGMNDADIAFTMGDQTASMLVRALETVWTRALQEYKEEVIHG